MSRSTANLRKQIKDQDRLIAALFKIVDQVAIPIGAGRMPRRASKKERRS